MFIKLTDNLKKTRPLARAYRGVVVDNNDPEKLKRIKVSIPGFMEFPKGQLPWSAQKEDITGGNSTTGFFAVPEIGDYVEITFPTEDVYNPVYAGWYSDENSKNPTFSNHPDYPHIFGYENSEAKLIINKAQGTIDFEHSSGFSYSVDADGNYSLEVPNDFVANVAKHIINASGDITHESGGNFEGIGAALAALRAPSIELGDAPSFHATLSENVIAYNDIHTHPAPQAPGGVIPTLPPTVPMSAKAGTALDVKALKILVQGNV